MPINNPDRETKTPAPGGKARWLKQVRQLHTYLGMFFAPSIIFFAFSGALQLFGLHEAHRGETYKPPVWIAKLASIHKDQAFREEKHGPPPGQDGQKTEEKRPPRSEGEHEDEDRGESKSTLVLKWFFLAMSIGLMFTTFLGIYMAFKFNRSRALLWTLLIAGAVIPVALIVMMT